MIDNKISEHIKKIQGVNKIKGGQEKAIEKDLN